MLIARILVSSAIPLCIQAYWKYCQIFSTIDLLPIFLELLFQQYVTERSKWILGGWGQKKILYWKPFWMKEFIPVRIFLIRLQRILWLGAESDFKLSSWVRIESPDWKIMYYSVYCSFLSHKGWDGEFWGEFATNWPWELYMRLRFLPSWRWRLWVQ